MELGLCVCGSMCVQSTVTSLARLIHFLIFLHSGKDYKITGTAIFTVMIIAHVTSLPLTGGPIKHIFAWK